MKNIKRIFISILFIFIFCFSSSYSVFAKAKAPETYSGACILMEEETGTILYEKNAYNKMYPASTTKVMTAILTLEYGNLEDTVSVSSYAISSIPATYSTASLKQGEELSVDNLLNVLLIASANDAAVCLAEYVVSLPNVSAISPDASSEEKVSAFCEMMNKKATDIGCKQTHFVNPNGIHNEDHYSTAYDLALIGKYAMQNEQFRNIVSKTKCMLPGNENLGIEDRFFNTTNELIRPNYSTNADNYYYQYANGIKTGYTDPAKSCIIASAKKDDTELIVVILYADKTPDGLFARPIDCINLFKYGFSNYKKLKLKDKGEIVTSVDINVGTEENVSLNLITQNDLTVLLPTNESMDLTPEINITSDLIAPIRRGDVVGNMVYKIEDKTYEIPLVAEHTVFQNNLLFFILCILCAIFLLSLFSILVSGKKKKRK